MSSSRSHGEDIDFINGNWVYRSDGKAVSDEHEVRSCGNCGKSPIRDGIEVYDGCVGKLTGNVINACCGHGDIDDAYVQFEDGSVVRGVEAVGFMRHTAPQQQ